MPEKPRFVMYWGSGCGGCDVSLLNTHELLLTLADFFEIVFWPLVMDGKKSDVETLPDGGLDLAFFNGAIRTTADEEWALLLRAKAKILVAYGACACHGSVLGLSNLSDAATHLRTIYLEGHGLDNPGQVLPATEVQVKEGTLPLPALADTVRTLDQTVAVDGFVPGCPPEAKQVERLLTPLLHRLELAAGGVLGAGAEALCIECPRRRDGRRIRKFYRAHELIPEPETCLLEQGLLCMGPATRSGCGALCPGHNIVCTGCYGPLPDTIDQGAALLAVVASRLEGPAIDNPQERAQAVRKLLAEIVDPAGTFYRFTLPKSLLGATRARLQTRKGKPA